MSIRLQRRAIRLSWKTKSLLSIQNRWNCQGDNFYRMNMEYLPCQQTAVATSERSEGLRIPSSERWVIVWRHRIYQRGRLLGRKICCWRPLKQLHRLIRRSQGNSYSIEVQEGKLFYGDVDWVVYQADISLSSWAFRYIVLARNAPFHTTTALPLSFAAIDLGRRAVLTAASQLMKFRRILFTSWWCRWRWPGSRG